MESVQIHYWKTNLHDPRSTGAVASPLALQRHCPYSCGSAARTAQLSAHRVHMDTSQGEVEMNRILWAIVATVILVRPGYAETPVKVKPPGGKGPRKYVSTAYIGVNATGHTKKDLEVVMMSYVLTAKREMVLIRAVRDDVDSSGRRLDRIRKTRYFAKDQPNIIRRLQRDIRVRAIPDTNLIQVSMTGPNRFELPEIVNAVASALVAETNRRFSSATLERIRCLESELAVLQREQGVLRQNVEPIHGASKELRAALLRARIALKTETPMELRALAVVPTEPIPQPPDSSRDTEDL